MNDPCTGKGGRDGKGRRGGRDYDNDGDMLGRSREEATMRLSANEQEVDNAIKSILEQFGNADKQECM